MEFLKLVVSLTGFLGGILFSTPLNLPKLSAVVVANEFLMESDSYYPRELPLFLRKLGRLPRESYNLKRALFSKTGSA